MKIRIIKVVIWASPFILVGWILFQHLVPSGKLTLHYYPDRKSTAITGFAGGERDTLIGQIKNADGSSDYYQLITANPLTFNALVPRTFTKATVSITYQNPDNQTLLQLSGKNTDIKTMMAATAPVLETLPDYWEKIASGSLVLWQKNGEWFKKSQEAQRVFTAKKEALDKWHESQISDVSLDTTNTSDDIEEAYAAELAKITAESQVDRVGSVTYATIDDFLAHLPDPKKIIEMNYSLNPFLTMPHYQPATTVTELNAVLRGPHELYTYINDNETINFSFLIQDANLSDGADPVKIVLFNESSERLQSVSLADDGITSHNGEVVAERTIQLITDHLKHGVYRIVISCDDDIFIKKISTFQHKVMFRNRIFLGDNPVYQSVIDKPSHASSTIYTDCNTVSAKTEHASGLQQLSIQTKKNSFSKKISQVASTEVILGLSGISKLIVPLNDITLRGSCNFALSQDQLFSTNYSGTTQLASVDNIDSFDYIIAQLPEITTKGDWLVASGTIEGANMYFDGGNYLTAHFSIFMPGLVENHRSLRVKEVTVQFEREPLKLKEFFPKLKTWLTRIMK